MPVDKEQEYSLLGKEAGPASPVNGSVEEGDTGSELDYVPRQRSLLPTRISKLVAVQVGILAAYTLLLGVLVSIFFPNAFSRSRNPYDLEYNTMHDAYQYRVKEVDYNFETTNAFKGAPIEDIEQQWTQLMNGPHTLRVPESEMERMGRNSVQIADDSGDYLAIPIAYHMLHCLYNIYRYNHRDFYGEEPGGVDFRVEHTDHCIDNLRQFVQCHAGNGFETYKWLDTRRLPWPVVSTNEVCVDWTHFDDWVRERSIPAEDMATMRNGTLLTHPLFGPVIPGDLHDHSMPDHMNHMGHGS